MKKVFLKWDPAWGWGDKIYYLGSWKDEGPFYMSNSALYTNGAKCYVPPRGRLAAGSFDENYYYGSISYDIYRDGNRHIDQELFVLDRDWIQIASWRPSSDLDRNNKYISNTISAETKSIAFRDPAKLPNGNLAVCTGGHRWGTFGNVCEVELSNRGLKIVNETILDSSMLVFKEIERVTFWNEWMFFSVNGGSSIWDPESRVIHVAKIIGSGIYRYHSTVRNSFMCYGPSVSNDLRMLYWIKRLFKINAPSQQNLIYQKGEWCLKARSPRHIFMIANASYPLAADKIRRTLSNLMIKD